MTRRQLGVGLAALVALVGFACSSTPSGDRGTPVETVEGTSGPVPQGFAAPAITDFKLNLVVTKQECFGSAGCFVQFTVTPIYTGKKIPDGVALTVIYEVAGPPDLYISSFEMRGMTFRAQEGESATTKSSAIKLTAKVTSIQVHGPGL